MRFGAGVLNDACEKLPTKTSVSLFPSEYFVGVDDANVRDRGSEAAGMPAYSNGKPPRASRLAVSTKYNPGEGGWSWEGSA